MNFIGPNDGLVVSGSDDGNFFVWDKSSGELKGVYEGDGSVVNVIEGHPSLPLLAVSGIDTTVKVIISAPKLWKVSDVLDCSFLLLLEDLANFPGWRI